MTEDEAKVKWCPMARIDIFPDASNVIVGNAGDRIAFCRGSACMMWRWDGEYKATKAGPIRQGDGEHGHCGLARY